MAAIILPHRWQQQPQYPAPVDFSHPVAPGLVRAFIPANWQAVPKGGVPFLLGQLGIGYQATSSSAYFQASSGKIISGQDAWTILAFIQTDQANTTNGRSVYCERAPSGNDILKLEGLVSATPNRAKLTVRNDGGSLIQLYGSSTINDGQPHILAGVRYASNDHRIFVDGRQENSTAVAVTATYTNSIESRIGADAGDATSYWTDPIYLVVLWNRALTPEEIASIGGNPWQVFKPIPRRIWVPGAAAAGTSVECSAGTIVLAGGTGALLSPTLIPAAAATVALSGQQATILAPTVIAATAATVPLAGQQATVVESTVIAASAGTIAVAGQQASLLELVGRYARPSSDVADGAWLPSTPGADLFAMVDEATVDDLDYDYTTSASTMELGLQPAEDPGTSSGQVIYYRARSAYGNTLTVTLKQGAAVIATAVEASVPTDWTDFSLELTPAECDAITDYRALSITFEAAA